jgi:hypothetical protein
MLAAFCRSFTASSSLARQMQFFDALQDGELKALTMPTLRRRLARL